MDVLYQIDRYQQQNQTQNQNQKQTVVLRLRSEILDKFLRIGARGYDQYDQWLRPMLQVGFSRENSEENRHLNTET